MRYIIILLTSLFLVSNASAIDYSLQTMEEHCAMIENNMLNAYNHYMKATDDITVNRHKAKYDWKSKTYHYLDCSDFR
jgi:hypothetical protein